MSKQSKKKVTQPGLPPLPVDLAVSETESLVLRNIGLEKTLVDTQYQQTVQAIMLRRAQWTEAFCRAHKLALSGEQLWEQYDVDVVNNTATLKSTKAAAS